MSAINERLAKSKLFRSRLENSVFGIYREFQDPLGEPIRCKRIELGYTSIEDQIQFLKENTDIVFYLQVDANEVDWTDHLDALAALSNIRGLGGAGIKQDEFIAFPKIEWVFLGEGCLDFDASQFPKLKYLQGSFDEGDRGVYGAHGLVSLSMSFSPRTKFDFTCIARLVALEALRVVYGKMEDVTQISELRELRLLDLDSAKQLHSINGLERLKKVSKLRISDAKAVKDWSPIENMSSLEQLKIYGCGNVQLSTRVKELPVFSVKNFPNCKVSFV